jgi:ATP-dependent DNA helicase PIF1
MEKEIDYMLNMRKNELLEKGYDTNKFDIKYSLPEQVESNYEELELEIDDKPIKSFLKRNKEPEKIIKYVKQNENKMLSIDKLNFNSLSENQKIAYRSILEGKSVFLTGKAGSGKSGVINLFYKQYRHKKRIGMTSTTGTSAILINGATLHSFLGIGLGAADVEFLYMNIKNRSYILKRWLELDTLIIDEISMLSPKLFDKLENLARVVRKNDLPFGGIQLILTGDFLQLPCVDSVKFCFEAESWNKCVNKIIYLTENFRQNDLEFHKCLSEVRIGDLSEQSVKLLKSREDVELKNEYGILPTKIYALNRDVDGENIKEINKLFEKDNELEFYEYQMEYEILKKGFKNPEEKTKKACNAPALLELCKGAQVMLLYNMDLEAKLANGSRGVIIDFVNDLPLVKFLTGEERIIDYHIWKIEENGSPLMTITQIPLKIAYAITVHRSQGLTVDYAEIDMEGIFEDGMAYVALSRVTSKEGLKIKNFRLGNIFANEKAVKFYKNLE